MKLYDIAVALVSNPRRTVALFTLVNIILASLVMMSFVSYTFAQGVGSNEAEASTGLSEGLKYLGAGISVFGSTIGAGIALYGATSAGLAALVERPELAAWVLINAGLGEGVAIYGLIISILILGA